MLLLINLIIASELKISVRQWSLGMDALAKVILWLLAIGCSQCYRGLNIK